MHPQGVVVQRRARPLMMAATQVTTAVLGTLCQAEPCCRCTSAASHNIQRVPLTLAQLHHHCRP